MLLLLLPALLLGSCGSIDYERQQPSSQDCTPANVEQDTAAEAAVIPSPRHLQLALSYAGTQEIGTNGGPEIEAFLASVNLPVGNPYCAAFVSFVLEETTGITAPDVRSGLAYHFITDKSIDARKVLRGTIAIPPGTILVWRRGNTIYGHNGFVTKQTQVNEFATIEANTSAGPYGNQRDGEGVWERVRSIQPGNYFRITNFTLVQYG